MVKAGVGKIAPDRGAVGQLGIQHISIQAFLITEMHQHEGPLGDLLRRC